jgi:hypothetical protein
MSIVEITTRMYPSKKITAKVSKLVYHFADRSVIIEIKDELKERVVYHHGRKP